MKLRRNRTALTLPINQCPKIDQGVLWGYGFAGFWRRLRRKTRPIAMVIDPGTDESEVVRVVAVKDNCFVIERWPS